MMVLVRFHGYPGGEGDGEGLREMWLSRVPAVGEKLTVDGALLVVVDVDWDFTGVEQEESGAVVGLNIDVHLAPRSWAPKRFAEPPALT